jgi:hypothetical membrane protein
MADRSGSQMQYQSVAGALLFAAGVLAFLGIITAEAFYPGYSTSGNQISDLGATQPPGSIIVQPSATIFNATMIVSGLLIIAAAYCIHRAFRSSAVTVSLGLFGIGVLGVGIFPGNFGDLHAIFALLTFVAGGISAVVAYKVETSPFGYFSVILGAVSLLNLFLYFILGESSPFAAFGLGGLERWIAYPILLWVTGFGGYLMGFSARAKT